MIFDIEAAIREIKQHGRRRWLVHALTEAFDEARKGKLKTYDEHTFELHWLENLSQLTESILEDRYRPGASTTFVVFEPMVREIFAARFRDRVVHHFLSRICGDWWDQRFINSSFACRVGKGTLEANKNAQHLIRSAREEAKRRAIAAGYPAAAWRERRFMPMIIKLDIKGYFMSLPRKKVYARIRWGLDRQFDAYLDDPDGFWLYRTCCFLWKQVLFDNPVDKAVKKGRLSNWDPEILPPRKSLFCQPPGIGIVIGNNTSQLASNVYLDQFDRFVTQELGYKRYGRYVDDFFFIVQGDEYARAKRDVGKMARYLREELELTLHPQKRYYQSIEKGMEFVGARIYPDCRFPSDRMCRKFHTTAQSVVTGQKDLECIVSYLGLMYHLDSRNFLEDAFSELGWEYRGL